MPNHKEDFRHYALWEERYLKSDAGKKDKSSRLCFFRIGMDLASLVLLLLLNTDIHLASFVFISFFENSLPGRDLGPFPSTFRQKIAKKCKKWGNGTAKKGGNILFHTKFDVYIKLVLAFKRKDSFYYLSYLI